MNQKSMNLLILMFLNDIYVSIVIEYYSYIFFCSHEFGCAAAVRHFFFFFYERAGAIIMAFLYSPDLLGNDLVYKHGNTVRTSAEKKK